MEELLICHANKQLNSFSASHTNKQSNTVLVIQINNLTSSVLDDKHEQLLKIKIKLNDQTCKR